MLCKLAYAVRGKTCNCEYCCSVVFFSSRRRHTRYWRDWSSDVCFFRSTSFRFQFVIKAEVARAERERMRDRSRAARRRAITAGRWAGGGQVPYGFQVVDNPDGPGKVLAHEPREAAFIREAAERVLAGENPTSIARWANGPLGLPPRKAARWTRRTLIQVLTGFPVQGKVVTLVEGKAVQIVDEDGEPVTIDPILSP